MQKRIRIQNPAKHQDGTFYENSPWLSAFNDCCKKLQLRCLCSGYATTIILFSDLTGNELKKVAKNLRFKT